MKKDSHKTEVIFLIEHDSSEVFAYFPKEKYNNDPDLYTCYAHIGQHSACNIHYAKRCKRAKPEQYKDLANELEQIGYNLDIKTRLSVYK